MIVAPRTSSVVLAAVVTASAAGSALAAFDVPNGVNHAWTRGVTANSAYAEWDTFTSVVGGTNTPDVGSSVNGAFDGSAPAWNVTNSVAGAINAGGNIYGFNGFAGTVTVPSFGLGAGYTTTILVQLATQGTEVTTGTALFGGVAPTSITELSRTALSQGFAVETLYEFVVPGNAAGYSFTFAADPHLSLDRVAADIYAAPVPAPAAAGLLGMGGLLAVGGRRRRR